jgi:hypothetical protein
MDPAATPVDHPSLLLAVGRLRRTQWVWAVLFAGLGGLALVANGFAEAFLPLTWIAIAALLALQPQPILLSLVAVAWGFSLVFLIPGVAQTIGTDPITRLLAGGAVEIAALAIVRIVLLVTAWNQFLFYRLLYGTQGAHGLDPALAPIPAVLANPSDRGAVWSRLFGFLGVAAALLSIPLSATPRTTLLGAAYAGSVFAVGLGLGAAFVPTSRRAMALTGVFLGCAALLTALLVGRALSPGA